MFKVIINKGRNIKNGGVNYDKPRFISGKI